MDSSIKKMCGEEVAVSNDEMHLWSQHTFATEAAAQWSKMNYQAGQEKYHVASVGACFKV